MGVCGVPGICGRAAGAMQVVLVATILHLNLFLLCHRLSELPPHIYIGFIFLASVIRIRCR